MMMGTDYGHHDHAADLEGLRNLKTAGGISARVYDKIVDANPRAAYALYAETVRTFAGLWLLLLAWAGPLHAAPEGTMTWGVHFTLAARWLDPGETEGVITPFMVLYALHDALVKPMPGSLTTPSLAESWTMSKDGLTYEFVLRKGARFHNGDPVTGEDVKFTFERYRGSSAVLFKEKVREVHVVGPDRVRFQLREPWPDFITFYGTSASGAGWVVPKKYVEQVGDEGFKKAPIGAGPFRFVSYTPGVELVAEAFDGYWRKTPNVRRLVFKVLPEESTRAAALKKGDVDIIYQISGPVAEEIRRAPNLRVIAPRTFGIFWIDFPDQWDPKSPWHDQRVRQAASLAIDRQALNQAETLGFSHPTGSIIPRGLEFALPLEPTPYDPISGTAGNAATRLQPYVTRGGIYAYGVIPEVDDLFQRQARELDRTKRETLLHQIQRILHDRVIYAPLYELGPLAGVSLRVAEAGVGLIHGFPYSAPFEDLKLKGP